MTSEIPFTTGQDASGDVTDLTRPLSHLGHVEEWLAVFHELDAGRQRNDLLAVLRELRAEASAR